MYGPKFNELLLEICIKNGIKHTKYNIDLIGIEYKNKRKFIWSRRFPNNPNSSCKIIDSKSLCSMVLQDKDIPVVLHQKMYRYDNERYLSQDDTNYGICLKLLHKHKKIVIKPDNAFEGNCVFLCETEKDVELALECVFKKYKTAAVSKYIEVKNEYRLFFLEGKILFIYKKIRPFVVGNGILTLAELLSQVENSAVDISFIKNSLDSIPANGEKITISWKHNLSQGGTSEQITDEKLCNLLSTIAISAGEAVDAHFVTIDIVESTNNEFQVLEINSGVAMDKFILQHKNGYEIAYKIYESAIKACLMD